MKLCFTCLKKCVINSTTCILIEPDIKKTSEEVDEDDGDDFLLDYQPIQEDPIKTVNYITSESQEGKKYALVNSDEIILKREAIRFRFSAQLLSKISNIRVIIKINNN